MTIVLGIETSCDDTSIAIVNSKEQILCNIISSQIDLHSQFGGIVPEIAARSHIDIIDKLILESLSQTKIKLEDIDVIAVTAGPGLIGGLIVGLMSAKTIASIYKKPLICVNHLEAHALTACLTNKIKPNYLLLLISGGHCQIILVKDIGNYQKIGGTIDDSLGESFDKVARMLGLGYPGGPIIEKLAKKGDENRFKLPLPLIKDKNHQFNFSFSGLKTAIRLLIENLAGSKLSTNTSSLKLKEQDLFDVCASFQKVVLDILYNRLKNTLTSLQQKNNDVANVVIAGGVAANRYLYENLSKKINKNFNINVIAPPINLCTDNAAMIAYVGLKRYQLGQRDGLDFKPQARWDFTQCSAPLQDKK